jgi:prevent-host-death family protein
MIKLNVREAKTHLSHYLEEVQKGEKILLCKRNYPVAGIKPIPSHRNSRLPIGLAKSEFQMPDTFFKELSDEKVMPFDGENS